MKASCGAFQTPVPKRYAQFPPGKHKVMTILDLRHAGHERRDVWAPGVWTETYVDGGGPGEPARLHVDLQDGVGGAGILAGGYRVFYAQLLELKGAAFRRCLEVLADPQRTPVYVHCTAGKDRTGMARRRDHPRNRRGKVHKQVCALAQLLCGASDDEAPRSPKKITPRRWSGNTH